MSSHAYTPQKGTKRPRSSPPKTPDNAQIPRLVPVTKSFESDTDDPEFPLIPEATRIDTIKEMNIILRMGCMYDYAIEKIIGRGSFGSVMTACIRKTNYITEDCAYTIKLQLTTTSIQADVYASEVYIMRQLTNDPKWTGVRMIAACSTGDTGNIIQQKERDIAGGIIIMDRYTADMSRFIVNEMNVHDIINQLSPQIKILHDLGYIHWDLFRKNVLYRDTAGVFTYSIADFGVARESTRDPYQPEYYYNRYYFNHKTVGILTVELGLTPSILIQAEYKGIVDYIIIYSFLRDVYSIPESKQRFVDYLYKYSHKGKRFFMEHLNLDPVTDSFF